MEVFLEVEWIIKGSVCRYVHISIQHNGCHDLLLLPPERDVFCFVKAHAQYLASCDIHLSSSGGLAFLLQDKGPIDLFQPLPQCTALSNHPLYGSLNF